mgnify:FL=1
MKNCGSNIVNSIKNMRKYAEMSGSNAEINPPYPPSITSAMQMLAHFARRGVIRWQ